MKDYIAKYIPVEGKIKPNDWFWGIPYGGKKTLYQNTSAVTVVELDGYTFEKVQLFLCSREIQKDREVYIEHNPIFNPKNPLVKADTLLMKVLEENPLVNIKHAFRPIGPVSPEAIWVKEGDEFIIDELLHITREDGNECNFFKIECPTCKTFH